MRLDPGNGNVMMGTDLLKKTTDVLNENLIAAQFYSTLLFYTVLLPLATDLILESLVGAERNLLTDPADDELRP